MTKRKQIKKSIRFDVLKRDSFKCQYCGATAPDVLLHIDHITPVSKGGTNDITNLITSCAACNLGKSDKVLSENTSLDKARTQMELLQERREQLDLLMQWREGLVDIKNETIDRISSYWSLLVPGYSLNESGINGIKVLLKKYSVDEICSAMDKSTDRYLRYQENVITAASVELAFRKLNAICGVTKACEDDPVLADLLYIRGIMRNRYDLSSYKEYDILAFLRDANERGIEAEKLKGLAVTLDTFDDFKEYVSIHARGEDNG